MIIFTTLSERAFSLIEKFLILLDRKVNRDFIKIPSARNQ